MSDSLSITLSEPRPNHVKRNIQAISPLMVKNFCFPGVNVSTHDPLVLSYLSPGFSAGISMVRRIWKLIARFTHLSLRSQGTIENSK